MKMKQKVTPLPLFLLSASLLWILIIHLVDFNLPHEFMGL